MPDEAKQDTPQSPEEQTADAAQAVAPEADDATVADEGRIVRTYDFRRPQHLSSDQMRALQRLHVGAAEELEEWFSHMYGVNLQVRLASVEEVAFGLMKELIPEFTYASILDVAPLGARGVMYVESQVCLAFVDRVLGGFSVEAPKPRPLTAIDEAAVEGVLNGILRTLQTEWKDFCEIQFTTRERRIDPELVQLWSAAEAVFAVTFSLSGAMGEGKIRICIPVSRLKAAVDGCAIRTAALEASPEKAAQLRSSLSHSLERAALPMTAYFGEVEVPIQNLMGLSVGDTIRLDHPVDDPIMLRVGPKQTFLGKMGLRGRRKAVQVMERVQECED
jgi:flagellar motor switch protein FliM